MAKIAFIGHLPRIRFGIPAAALLRKPKQRDSPFLLGALIISEVSVPFEALHLLELA